MRPSFSNSWLLLTVKIALVVAIFIAQLNWGDSLQGEAASLFFLLTVFSINLLLIASCCEVFRAENLFATMRLHPAFIFALLLLFTALPMAFTPPVSSWDGLSFWFRDAARAADSGSSNISFLAANDQPNTLIIYYATVTRSASGWANYFIAWDLFVLWVGSVLVAVRYSRASAHAQVFAALWLLLLPQPLVLNHVFLIGYAEMWVGALIAVCPFLLDRLLQSRSSFLDKALLCFIALCFVAIKDSGFLYLAIVCASAFLVYCRARSKIAVLIFVTCISCFLALTEISVGSPPESVQPHYTFKLGGHLVSLNYPATGIRFSNVDAIVHAFFMNQTFSLTAMLVVCFGFVAGTSNEAWTGRQKISIYILACGFATICLLPLKINYFYAHGAPGGDTSFSRMFLPLLPLFGTLLAMYIGQASLRSKWRERTSIEGHVET